jgi:hypothetical protein
MTGPAAIFDSQHVYGAGQPSMDMDSVGCTAPEPAQPCSSPAPAAARRLQPAGRRASTQRRRRQHQRATNAAARLQVAEGGVVAHRDNRGAIYRFKVRAHPGACWPGPLDLPCLTCWPGLHWR